MSRYAFSSDEDQQPVTWLRGHAIYGAHVLVVVFVASLLVTSMMMTFGGGNLLSWVIFSSADVLRGQVWRIATYGLVNPPSIGFVVDMFLIVWFGRELEKFFGRRTFFTLYAGLYFITPVLFTALGLRWPLALSGVPGALALFTAFATLYPNVPIFFGILVKWAAALLVGIFFLIHLSNHNWPELLALLATNGFAFAFVRYAQGRFTLPELPTLKRAPERPALTDATPVRAKPVRDSKAELMAEVDVLLDRIATSGIESLSAKERARLDSARETLLKQTKARR